MLEILLRKMKPAQVMSLYAYNVHACGQASQTARLREEIPRKSAVGPDTSRYEQRSFMAPPIIARSTKVFNL